VKCIFVRLDIFENDVLSYDSEIGIVNVFRLVQLEKALFPTKETESGIVTDTNEEQYENALPPIDVTESGIVIEVKEEQP